MLRAALLMCVLVACNSQLHQIKHGNKPEDYPGISDFTYSLSYGDGYVNASLTWKTPSQSSALLGFYSFTTCRDNVEPCDVYKVKPVENNLKLNDLDFWTTYTVTGYAFYKDHNVSVLVNVRSAPAQVNVSTGRGSPRTPVYVSATVTNSTAALLSWFDPTGHRREPTKYITEFCPSGAPCFNVTTIRSRVDAYQLKQTNLKEKTLYNVKLYAVITNGVHTYTSKPIETSFTTHGYEYKPLRGLQYTLKPRASSADVLLTWGPPESQDTPCSYRFQACSDGSVCAAYEVTAATELLIKDKPYFNTSTVVGYACYCRTEGTLCSEGASVSVSTGAGNPKAPGYIEAKAVAPTVATAVWADPTKGSRKAPNFYKVDICGPELHCHREYTVLYQDNETYSVTAYDLTAATTYHAKVTAVLTYQGKDYMSDPAEVQFATPTSDFLPPVHFEAVAGPRKERTTDISFTWSVPQHVHRNLSGYRLLVCEEVDSKCTVYKAKGDVTAFTVKNASYWQNYTTRAYALFEDYGATVESPSVGADVFTGPVAPWVDDFEVTAMPVPSIEVKWDGPNNGHVMGYNVTVCNTKTRLCEEAIFPTNPQDKYQRYFNGIDAWTNYTVVLYGYYMYQNHWYNGTHCDRTVRTLPEEPDPVQDAKFTLTNLTVANLSWKKPAVLRGPLGGYTVVCKSSHDETPLLFNNTVDANVTQLTVDLEEQQTDFECNITAYNFFSKRRIYGSPVRLNLHTLGIPAPTHLNITWSNATAVALQWDVDPNARNYSVHFSSVAEGLSTNSVGNFSGSNETHTYEDDNLKPWTAYNITVQNCGEQYCGKKGILHAKTDAAAPSEVQDFKFVVQDYVKLSFNWSLPEHPNGPVDGYLLNISNLEHDEKTSHKIDGQRTSFTANVTDQYTRYQASLVAFNRHHGGALYGPAAVLNITTQGKGAMPPYPDPTKVDSDSALIEWQVPDDKKHKIVVYQVNVTNNEGHEIFNATVPWTNVTVDHLHPWSNYTVAVESCTDNATCGPVFKAAKFRTDVSAPSVPRNLKSTDVTKDSIILCWEEPSVHNGPIDGYIVKWSNGSGHTSAVTKGTGFNITGLPASTNCTVEVLAFNIGYKEQKRGPAATLSRVTLPSVATATIVLAVVLPILAIAVFVGGYMAYKKYKGNRSGMSILQNAE